MSDKDKLESFETAFRDGTAGCVRDCHCGNTYFHDDSMYSWEEGELERLTKTATSLDYSPGDISFDGRTYVDACECWHERAYQVINFLESHGHKIAAFLKLEKERALKEAAAMPTVTG